MAQVVRERITEWEADAALEVSAPDNDEALRIASEVLMLVRFFMRQHIRVNVETHRVGLAGDFADSIRDYLVLWEDEQPTAATAWKRIGGTIPFTFREAVLNAWESDSSLTFLRDQLAISPDERPDAARRAYLALVMNDAGEQLSIPVDRSWSCRGLD